MFFWRDVGLWDGLGLSRVRERDIEKTERWISLSHVDMHIDLLAGKEQNAERELSALCLVIWSTKIVNIDRIRVYKEKGEKRQRQRRMRHSVPPLGAKSRGL